MEITGIRNNPIPVNKEKMASSKSHSSFEQVLNKAVNKKNPQGMNPSAKDKSETKDSEGLLSFLKNNDLKQVTDAIQGKGIQVIGDQQSMPQTDLLQIVKSLLGISDKKWSEIMGEIKGNPKDKLAENDPINVGLSGLNDNMTLFLKAAKLYSLLSNQNSQQQYLAGLLDSSSNHLQEIDQTSQSQSKLMYLQNTFSQLVSDINAKTMGSTEENRLKAVNRLTDWNGNSPFFQQMSKPEQLAVMMNGTQKSVSVNDLIQQFESILSKSQFSKNGGIQKLFIKLNPESLGSIRIELIQKDQMITARILATTEAAKEALESHLHNLKHAFEAQNIKVDNVQIGQQSQQEDFFNRGERDQQEHPQHQRQETSGDEDSSDSFTLTLEAALLNQEV
ncbi:flagellar hook-length control protein FliK [Bacillus sp. EB600]|uniref:flagellar hook-length control protein FliK n=1 Tax=Bacillus sp. EB600 TaxID=2806345 RepID=UPI00210C85F3|nr:flagellar hook-length control protein FliK [Bacillus sp. EB600]MCQ6280197.1 flagellar hook-length control protein FliK [Bacillus sp. EB600]